MNEIKKNRTEELLKAPQTMDNIFTFIANGGSLRDYCERMSLNYIQTARWVFEDAYRKTIYNDACLARREVLIRPSIEAINLFNSFKRFIRNEQSDGPI